MTDEDYQIEREYEREYKNADRWPSSWLLALSLFSGGAAYHEFSSVNKSAQARSSCYVALEAERDTLDKRLQVRVPDGYLMYESWQETQACKDSILRDFDTRERKCDSMPSGVGKIIYGSILTLIAGGFGLVGAIMFPFYRIEREAEENRGD